MNTYSIVLVCLILIAWAKAEIFTAISDCEPLLNTHRQIIDDLDGYLQKEEKRLLALKKQLNTYKAEHEKAMEDIPNYLGNPINAFTLIKRLTKDLEKIDFPLNVTLKRENAIFPTYEDLVGAAKALTRLQATYKLDAKDLAEGLLNGVSYSSSMSADDCFELGRTLFNDGHHENSIAWMKQALRKYNDDENDIYYFTVVDVMDYVSWSYQTIDDPQNALEWINKLLVLDPTHVRALANKLLFENRLAENALKGELKEMHVKPKQHQYFDRDFYEALCRGDYELAHEITKKLYCFYLTENHPFLRLAPIKAEKKYADPEIYVFYDVTNDGEIAHIKDMEKSRFERAKVVDAVTGTFAPSQYRISKIAWINDHESPIVARLTRRIADFTGLDQSTAEPLQVSNYGIGGHYEPHYDFPLKGEAFQARSLRNRIATVLIYMSEVAQGGATVFTELGLSVFPVKNAALFWLNLHPSGEGDLSTRHAACPVLRGSKWVSNKWIHQGGQELIKKTQCNNNMEYQQEEWVRPVPKPILKTKREM